MGATWWKPNQANLGNRGITKLYRKVQMAFFGAWTPASPTSQVRDVNSARSNCSRSCDSTLRCVTHEETWRVFGNELTNQRGYDYWHRQSEGTWHLDLRYPACLAVFKTEVVRHFLTNDGVIRRRWTGRSASSGMLQYPSQAAATVAKRPSPSCRAAFRHPLLA